MISGSLDLLDDALEQLAGQPVAGQRTAFLDLGPAAPYDRALVLARPAQHVAWRGGRLPADPAALIDRLRGAA